MCKIIYKQINIPKVKVIRNKLYMSHAALSTKEFSLLFTSTAKTSIPPVNFQSDINYKCQQVISLIIRDNTDQ